MQPVLEIDIPDDDFDLWPVAELKPFSYLPINGGLSPAETGAAMMLIVGYNDIGPEPGDDFPPPPADPLGSFLHGMLTSEDLFVAGGLRVVDSSAEVTLLPGCCCGLEGWREWHEVVDGSDWPWLGHDPQPTAERSGDTVLLTVESGLSDSPVIELSAAELRQLLAGVERDLADFVALAAAWTSQHLPGHSVPLTAALCRLLDLPSPTVPRGSKTGGQVR
ncbi:hypothetical protein [Kitasatospora sp. NPDC002040]|uniref:hypothetical protein n=1 Tax=Kitasatospora sp. NPDC002040 TaxID=3154661 RepID=UPI003319E8AE